VARGEIVRKRQFLRHARNINSFFPGRKRHFGRQGIFSGEDAMVSLAPPCRRQPHEPRMIPESPSKLFCMSVAPEWR
jgi:hypothetical protein